MPSMGKMYCQSSPLALNFPGLPWNSQLSDPLSGYDEVSEQQAEN